MVMHIQYYAPPPQEERCRELRGWAALAEEEVRSKVRCKGQLGADYDTCIVIKIIHCYKNNVIK